VIGVRKGNVVAFGARDPSGVERDRERVVVAFEVQEAGAPRPGGGLVADVRKAVQEGMGLTLDDVVALPPGRACRRRRAASSSAPRRGSSTRRAS
jgi:fatty-acyl-CoA synthase